MTQPSRRGAIAVLALAGGGCVIAGAVLPWLTVYAGLDSYSGIAGSNGRLLVAGGATAVLLGVSYAVSGAAVIRYALGALGFALALFSAYLAAELLSLYKQLHGIFLPGLGPGVFVAVGGALLLLSTMFVDLRAGRGRRPDAATVTLLSLSAASGTVHLTVAADHFAEYFLFGLFFVVVGVAQVAWAVLVAATGPSRPLLMLATANALVVVLWLLSRTSGLPIGPARGVPEAAGFADVATTLFETALVVISVLLLARPRQRARGSSVAWALPLVIAPLTILAVLSAVGAIGFLPETG